MGSSDGVPSEGWQSRSEGWQSQLRQLRGAAVMFSLANLTYWPVWQTLFDLPSPYFGQAPPPSVYLVAALLGVSSLALGLLLLRGLLRRRARTRAAADWVVLLAWLLPLSLLWGGAESLELGTPGRLATRVVGACALVALAYWVFRQRARALLAAELLALVFLPFLGVTAARSLWAVGAAGAGPDPPPAVALAPPQSAPRGAPRVVWIVMDEFDYRLAFDERPESIALPAFDRLRGESLFATQASAPAWRTLLSMPALINGKYVAEAAPQSASELSIRFEGERESKEWSRLPNLFSRTHERGGNVAVVGFYHPYCQLFPTALSRCSVEPFLTSWGQPTLGTAMRAQWGSLLADVPALAVLGLGDLARPWRDDPFMLGLRNNLLGLNRQLLEAARPLLGRRDLQLVLIHLAVPHPPGVFDRRANTASISPEANYLDNLELADQTLAELRELAEEAGTWHDSTWIISSDHWWKSNFWAGEPGWTQEEARLDVGEKDQRIPFIVKLAGARDAVEYRRPLNTVLSADLIETLWSDPWSSHRELAAWLASRASP